ncbi:Uncharacterized protein pbN1_10710 [Aromatoleum bremense]|nr:Uncharacterized protein pbN1_10710 [Aromatoleum bremense]
MLSFPICNAPDARPRRVLYAGSHPWPRSPRGRARRRSGGTVRCWRSDWNPAIPEDRRAVL